jgi:hypothetical protein
MEIIKLATSLARRILEGISPNPYAGSIKLQWSQAHRNDADRTRQRGRRAIAPAAPFPATVLQAFSFLLLAQ